MQDDIDSALRRAFATQPESLEPEPFVSQVAARLTQAGEYRWRVPLPPLRTTFTGLQRGLRQALRLPPLARVAVAAAALLSAWYALV
jgi:hypothetical protein